MKTIALTLIILFTGFSVQATTYYWVASAPGNWNDAANWSSTFGGVGGAGIPGAGDNVIFNAAGLDKNGNCTLSNDVTVNSITTLNYLGTIHMGSYSITYTNSSLGSGTITGTGSLHAVAGGSSQWLGMDIQCSIDGTQASLSVESTISGDISLQVTTAIDVADATFLGTLYLDFSGSTGLPTLQRCTFHQALTIVNRGAVNVYLRDNTYKNQVTLRHEGAVIVGFTSTGNEVFEADVLLWADVNKSIYMADEGTSQYSGDVVAGAPIGTSSAAIYWGLNGGTSSFSGAIIPQNGIDIRFTQSTFNANLTILNSIHSLTADQCTFNGALTVMARALVISNSQLNGNSWLEDRNSGVLSANTIADGATLTLVSKGSSDFTVSNNTYGGQATFVRYGSGSIRESGSELFKSDVLAIDSSYASNINRIYFQGTITFQGNVSLVNANAFNTTIQIGGTVNTATLIAGKTITLADNGGYVITRLVQNGTDSVKFVLTTASLTVVNGQFNAPVRWSARTLTVNGNTFNNTAQITYTGSGTSTNGNNTFNAAAHIIANGSGTFRFGNSADTYNNQVTFTSRQGTLQPAYNAKSVLKGDLIVESIGGAQIVFGANTNGSVEFNGTGNQSITMSGTTIPVFNRFMMNKTSGTFTRNGSLIIGVSMTLTRGIVPSSSTEPVVFNNGATTSGASALSFIDGPVKKIGNQAFTFPVGDAGVFRSIAMSAPSATTDAFTAEFFRSSHGHTDPATYGTGVVTVGSCEYWTLDRTTGSANVNVTLGWNTADCSITITDLTKLAVARWDGAQWINHGNGGTTGNTSLGTVTTSAAVTSFSPFALASIDMMNPLPIELLSFEATSVGNAVALNWVTASEHNSSYFIVERSADLQSFEGIGEVTAAGNSTRTQSYTLRDQQPLSGLSYYRLKQVDIDGSITYYRPVSIEMNIDLVAFPNPSNADFHLNAKRDITILDSQGQVCQQLISADKIDLSGRAAGVYILVTSNGERLKLMKVN